MLIKITFKDLVNCNPTDDLFRPMVSLRIQDTEIIIPEETFRWIKDGCSVVLEVKQFHRRGPILEFETIAGHFPSARSQIDPDIVLAIHRV